MLTDGVTRVDFLKNIHDTGFAHDQGVVLGAGIGEGFDECYVNQQKLFELENSKSGEQLSQDELTEAARLQVASSSNAHFNLFNKGASSPQKLLINPGGMQVVLPEKYVAARDRRKQIEVVDSIVYNPGYDITVDRIDEGMKDIHISDTAFNMKNRRNHKVVNSVGAELSGVPDMSSIFSVNGSKLEMHDNLGRKMEAPINEYAKSDVIHGKNIVTKNYVSEPQNRETTESFRYRK
jgi:hypothetical protein